jgi:hypothetical protein
MRYDPGPNIHDRERHTVRNGCMNDIIRDGIVDYFHEQGWLYGECYAPHIVRVFTKFELRDEEKDAIDLPFHYTQMNMY